MVQDGPEHSNRDDEIPASERGNLETLGGFLKMLIETADQSDEPGRVIDGTQEILNQAFSRGRNGSQSQTEEK